MIFKYMTQRLQIPFLIILIPIIFISYTFELDARKKKRSYNRDKTRTMAIETLETSDELSKLVNFGGGEYPDEDVNIEYIEGEDINELELEDDIVFSIDQIHDIYLSFVEGYEGDDALTSAGLSKKAIIDNITEWLGTPYRFGGTTSKAIDCSAFVLTMFKNSGNIQLPRTARAQYKAVGVNVKVNELQFGDLVFFNTRHHAYVSHVGIYLGDHLFAHASSKYGVTISSMESGYYSKRFIGAKRLTSKDLVNLSRN